MSRGLALLKDEMVVDAAWTLNNAQAVWKHTTSSATKTIRQ